MADAACGDVFERAVTNHAWNKRGIIHLIGYFTKRCRGDPARVVWGWLGFEPRSSECLFSVLTTANVGLWVKLKVKERKSSRIRTVSRRPRLTIPPVFVRTCELPCGGQIQVCLFCFFLFNQRLDSTSSVTLVSTQRMQWSRGKAMLTSTTSLPYWEKWVQNMESPRLTHPCSNSSIPKSIPYLIATWCSRILPLNWLAFPRRKELM